MQKLSFFAMMLNRITNSLLSQIVEARDQKEVKQMNKYELCVVLSAKLDDEERAAAIEKIKGYIARYNGTVSENIEEWGKKRLAYEIQHMKEAYYYFIPFTGDANTPNELESQIRIMEPVIRYLVVKPEAETEAAQVSETAVEAE